MPTSARTSVRTRVRGVLRRLAVSPPARALARELESRTAVRDALETHGHGARLRRLAVDPLPPGHRYAQLTLENPAAHDGADVHLIEHGEVVYGARIEAPPAGAALEIRNIVVSSSDPTDVTIDLPAPYRLDLSPLPFTTPEQDAYDRKYGVRRRDGLFSSVRGNTTNPSRLLVTFPGFPPANSRVSYAVSYLKALTEEDLADTLMVCVQDRYAVAGTYMVRDDAGRPLVGRLTAAVTALRQRYGIAEEDVLLFGASKGASIAAMTAHDLPGAHLVLVAPQMDLPYYCAKPVLRGGLFRDRALWEIEQPGALLRRYLAGGRRIDYFYSDSDESSNASLIEYAGDAEGLTKHRIGGAHADVAKRSLPTVLSLLRGFASGAGDSAADGANAQDAPGETASPGPPLVCTELTTTRHGALLTHRVQLADDSVPGTANVYLEGRLGRTRFRQLLSTGTDPAARYTSENQRVDPALHPASFTHVVAIDGSGRRRVGELPAAQSAESPDDAAEVVTSRHPQGAPEPLTCHAVDPRDYALLGREGAASLRVRYLGELLDPHGDTAELRLVASLEDERGGPSAAPDLRARLTMAALTGWHDLPVLARRVAVAAEVEQLHVLVADPHLPEEQLRELAGLEWPAVTLERIPR
ncbi:hypothetical protein [Brachybacterium sp.]|uniref:hypothetical protein n=1 Tax=Brachybacterium sp. TaxID=1891286 RepID=UPI002ED50D51